MFDKELEKHWQRQESADFPPATQQKIIATHFGSNVEDAAGAGLTPEHREYLMQRHGTLNLDPLPSANPADPLNWPDWKVVPSLYTHALLPLPSLMSFCCRKIRISS